ncbi:MAG: heavy-metal-associated domain-containing protein [Thermoleophilia bacterium]|nr:heavy-metal-associated domain-containing protein [Thermoleophilia bacterium]
MRERITLDQIRCERCVSRLAENLAPLKGINDARIEMGSSSIVVDYDDEQREALDEALGKANFRIVEREPVETVAS